MTYPLGGGLVVTGSAVLRDAHGVCSFHVETRPEGPGQVNRCLVKEAYDNSNCVKENHHRKGFIS